MSDPSGSSPAPGAGIDREPRKPLETLYSSFSGVENSNISFRERRPARRNARGVINYDRVSNVGFPKVSVIGGHHGKGNRQHRALAQERRTKVVEAIIVLGVVLIASGILLALACLFGVVDEIVDYRLSTAVNERLDRMGERRRGNGSDRE